MDNMGRIMLGVATVIGTGVAGYYVGRHFKHEKIGAGVGVGVGVGVNYLWMRGASATAQPATT
jgi:hypothetical protein